MATAHQIRDLITETTTGTARPQVPREVRDKVCRHAVRRRKAGAAWTVIAREAGFGVRKLQRWNTRARRGRPCEAGASFARPAKATSTSTFGMPT